MVEMGKWEIEAEGRLTRDGYQGPDQQFTILHIDKDEAYRKEFYDRCIFPFFHSAGVLGLEHGEQAFKIVEEFIDNKTPLHLIITDVVLTGLGGPDLIKKIREYESISGIEHRVPIIILSTLPDVIAKYRFNGGQDLQVEHYFEKYEEVESILGFLEEILYKKRN